MPRLRDAKTYRIQRSRQRRLGAVGTAAALLHHGWAVGAHVRLTDDEGAPALDLEAVDGRVVLLVCGYGVLRRQRVVGTVPARSIRYMCHGGSTGRYAMGENEEDGDQGSDEHGFPKSRTAISEVVTV